MKHKKNSTFTFICSFLPGAAEMYMGFMKMGLSLMAMFFFSFAILTVLEIGDIFAVIPALVWFYGFFHARNLAHCEEEELQGREDVSIWEEFLGSGSIRISDQSVRRWIAGILIVCGVMMIWNYFKSIIYALIPESIWDEVYPIVRRCPQIVIAVLLIAAGVKLIMGKKEEVYGEINGEIIGQIREERLGEGCGEDRGESSGA